MIHHVIYRNSLHGYVHNNGVWSQQCHTYIHIYIHNIYIYINRSQNNKKLAIAFLWLATELLCTIHTDF